jgi:lactate permease
MNLFPLFFAALPILIFLFVVLAFKWSGLRASVLAWLSVILISYFYFGASIELLQYAQIKSLFVALDILLIIWSALFIHKITEKAGTIQKMGSSILEVTNNRALSAIFLGWLFPSFLQGIGGFGVPVAICAPLLINAGFSPVQSIVMSSIGHAWSITFGSMGIAFQALMSATGFLDFELAPYSSILLGVMAIVCGYLVVIIASGVKKAIETSGFIIIFGSLLGFGQYFLSTTGFWTIAVVISSIITIGLGLFIFWSRQKFEKPDNRKDHDVTNSKLRKPTLLISVLPYGLIVLFSIIEDIITSFSDVLGRAQIYLLFPEIASINQSSIPEGSSKQIDILTHPGTIIFISALVSYWVLKRMGFMKNYNLRDIFKDVMAENIDPSLTLVFMAGIAMMMDHSQLLFLLAKGISSAVDTSTFPFIAPFIGALGAFITGSNTNSNMLFASLQLQTANILGINNLLILGLQTAGGAIGSIVAPAKVIVGCSTVKLINKENLVFIELLKYVALLLSMVGIIGYLLLNI